MKPLSLTRGHESSAHVALKSEVVRFLRGWGYAAVLAEHHCCDVVATRSGWSTVISVEIERSDRNVVKNTIRDLSQGSASVLVICPDLKVLGDVVRKLTRGLPAELWPRLAVATISTLRMLSPLQSISECPFSPKTT